MKTEQQRDKANAEKEMASLKFEIAELDVKIEKAKETPVVMSELVTLIMEKQVKQKAYNIAEDLHEKLWSSQD